MSLKFAVEWPHRAYLKYSLDSKELRTENRSGKSLGVISKQLQVPGSTVQTACL